MGIVSSLLASMILRRYSPSSYSKNVTIQVINQAIKAEYTSAKQEDNYFFIFISLAVAFVFLLAIYPTQVVLCGWAVVAFFSGLSLFGVTFNVAKVRIFTGISLWSVISAAGTIFIWWIFTRTLTSPSVMDILYGQGPLIGRLLSEAGADIITRTLGVFALAISLVYYSLLQAVFMFCIPLAFTNDFWHKVVFISSRALTRSGILTHLGLLLFAFFLIKYGISCFAIFTKLLNQ